MRSSYSQNNTYKKCPSHWAWKYIHKLQSPVEGASLYFGSAVDDAVMAMLKGQTDYINLFKNKWYATTDFKNNPIPVFDNPNITYSYNDFDPYVLKDKDHEQLIDWAMELGVEALGADGVEIYKAIAKLKKNPYKHATTNQLGYFNRASWLSMKRKGEVLITSFKEQFYPKITKVHATQIPGFIKDENTGDMIQGFLDMIVEVEGYDKPIIIDLKTSANPYTEAQLDHSDQLTLYAAMKGKEYNTDLVGYVVLCKNIPKVSNATCVDCGHTKTGRHKTCDNVINDARCSGEWAESKKLAPEVQVLIQKKGQQEINNMLLDIGNIVHAMKEGIIYKNTDHCKNWYGGVCPYFNACHKNDLTGLTKR